MSVDPDRIYLLSGEYITKSTSATPLSENLCNIIPSHTSYTLNVPPFVPDTIFELSRENANERIPDRLISKWLVLHLSALHIPDDDPSVRCIPLGLNNMENDT